MIENLSGNQMLLGLIIGLAVLIFLVLKTKIHAFVALIIATVVIGVIGGMPLVKETFPDGKSLGIIMSITKGFGGTLSGIGIIIGFGVILGKIFEISGAAQRMAITFLNLFGKKREEEAMAITGFFVSIPIFCDSGFIVVSPIAKAIARTVKKSVIGIGAALAGGLVITHSMVPPTPGPLGVAGIFGNLIKHNASISGAECGCQAEIGAACSMAAAAMGELTGLSIDEQEYAAEIAMEHHLGLTCDPICGLVQIPCIERNAVAAKRAIDASNLAHMLVGTRTISFDMVVRTMYETGINMSRAFRETSEGGLARLYSRRSIGS